METTISSTCFTGFCEKKGLNLKALYKLLVTIEKFTGDALSWDNRLRIWSFPPLLGLVVSDNFLLFQTVGY